MRRALPIMIATVAVLIGPAASARAQGAHQHDAAQRAPRPARLGTVHFPTSATGQAQADFIEGVLYLHSFEYEAARDAFRRAQQRAPGFAMAYWGDAQTWNHPVWNQRDADSARAALARLAPTAQARAARAATARERAWLNTVEVLYGEGPKPLRDSLYLRSMEALAAEHPDDDAKVFLALAWLGLNQSDRRVSDYMRAAALAQEVFARSPDHPGAAHLVIHAFDDPEHAVLGLKAARAYSTIAPGAAHAQHMTTHIFLALGMWPENNTQNRIALDASGGRSGHYAEWLAYGLQQQGRFREAQLLVDSMRATAGKPGWRWVGSLPMVRASYVVDRGDWSIARDRALIEGTRSVAAVATDGWLYATGAAMRRDSAGVAAGLARLRSAEADAQAHAAGGSPAERQLVSTLRGMAEGVELAARGDTTRALAALASAQATFDSVPVMFGPPVTPMPVGEYRAELLLARGRASDAIGAMATLHEVLRANPGRSRALTLLVRAALLAGDTAVAARARAQLALNWAQADDGGAALRALAVR